MRSFVIMLLLFFAFNRPAFADGQNLCDYAFAKSQWLNDGVLNEQAEYVSRKYFIYPATVIFCDVKELTGGSAAAITLFSGEIVVGIDNRFLKNIRKNDYSYLAGALIGHELAHGLIENSDNCRIAVEQNSWEEFVSCEEEADRLSASITDARYLVQLLKLSRKYYERILEKGSASFQFMELLTERRIKKLESYSWWRKD